MTQTDPVTETIPDFSGVSSMATPHPRADRRVRCRGASSPRVNGYTVEQITWNTRNRSRSPRCTRAATGTR